MDPEGPPWYLNYYVIIALFLDLALLFGRRAGCHSVCWMAPFMILGRRTCNLFRWPALRLRAEADKCSDCQRCTQTCSMSLAVHEMVGRQEMENDECILCGNCVDGCPKGAISFSFSAGR